MKKVDPEAGVFIHSNEAAVRTKKFRDKKQEEGLGPDDFVRSQFFGRKKIEALLDKFPNAAGVRVYHSHSEDPIHFETFLLVAVSEDGKDLVSTQLGLKDPDDEPVVLADGPPCPHSC